MYIYCLGHGLRPNCYEIYINDNVGRHKGKTTLKILFYHRGKCPLLIYVYRYCMGHYARSTCFEIYINNHVRTPQRDNTLKILFITRGNVSF